MRKFAQRITDWLAAKLILVSRPDYAREIEDCVGFLLLPLKCGGLSEPPAVSLEARAKKPAPSLLLAKTWRLPAIRPKTPPTASSRHPE